MADEDTKTYKDCGPSNRDLGIDFGDLMVHLRNHGTKKMLHPVRGKLLIERKAFSVFNTRPRCDICNVYAGIVCKDGIVRCRGCRFRYSASFRWKPWKRKVLT